MKGRLGMALWAALFLLAGPARAAMSGADCASLTIHLKDIPEAAQAKCEAGGFDSGNYGNATEELIQIDRPAYWLVVEHLSTGVRTYVIRRGVKDIIGEFSVFENIEDWSDETEVADFTVRHFKATMKGGSSTPVPCVGFSHYSGHVPQTTGYRHHISGFYCNFTTSPPTDTRIEQLLSAIDYDF